MRRILIIGGGAVGVGLAHFLGERGHAVRFGGRLGPIAVSAVVETPDPRTICLPAPTPTEISAVEAALVAVRAGDLAAALAAWAPRLAPGTPVVPVGNGAVEDLVREAAAVAPALRWRIGCCTAGVSRVAPGRYALRSTAGEVVFGPLVGADAAPTGCEREIAAVAPFRWSADVLPLVRRKWLYNVVLNTLTAARRLPRNGELLADLPTLAAVFDEALALAQSLWGPLRQPRDELWRGLLQLVQDTADNENSMARDVRLGRPTEAAFLAGLATDARRYPLLTRLQAQLPG